MRNGERQNEELYQYSVDGGGVEFFWFDCFVCCFFSPKQWRQGNWKTGR